MYHCILRIYPSSRNELGPFILWDMYVPEHPNILIWLTYGFSLEKYSSKVFSPSTQWGVRFSTYTIVVASFSQRCIGRSWSCIIVFAASMMVLFFRSTTPFFWGLYGVLNSLLISDSPQSSLNSSDVNYPPLFERRILIFLSVWFSTKALYSLNLLKTSVFLSRNISKYYVRNHL